MPMATRDVLALAARWFGRLLALLLLLFWGAFFVEHLGEWYLRADGRYPPAWVGVSMVLHFAMLAGLLVMLRWEWPGTLVTLLATAAFFAFIGVRAFPTIALVNLLPLPFFALAWLLSRPAVAAPPPLPPPVG